jgi:hypothetical protein
MRLSLADDSDKLRIRVDGGRISFGIGTTLLVLGLVLLALTSCGNANRPIVAALLGTAFVAVGVIFAFSSSGFVIDRRLRRITAWSSFLSLTKTHEYDVGRFDALRLVPYWNRSRHGPVRLFRILLSFHDTQSAPLELGSGISEARAREHLARIAELTGLSTVETPTAGRDC